MFATASSRNETFYVLDGEIISTLDLTKEEGKRLAHGEGKGPFESWNEANRHSAEEYERAIPF